jgi:hypothetical protein
MYAQMMGGPPSMDDEGMEGPEMDDMMGQEIPPELLAQLMGSALPMPPMQ